MKTEINENGGLMCPVCKTEIRGYGPWEYIPHETELECDKCKFKFKINQKELCKRSKWLIETLNEDDDEEEAQNYN